MSEPLTLTGLAGRPLWVAWQTESRPDGKPTKVPYNPRGGKARADKPATWGIRPDAEMRAAKLPKPYGLGGIGIEFCPLGDGRSLAGIDLDSCRDAATGSLEPWAEDVIATFDTYSEVSPSDTGAKVFFLYETAALQTFRPLMGVALYGKQFKRGGGDHPAAVELHLGNRFFAATDKLLIGCRPELREVEAGTIAHLLQTTGPAFVGNAPGAKKAGASKAKAAPGGSMDRSRSSAAFRVGKEAVASGADFDGMCKAIQDTAETAEWYREKGAANSGRELRRIFDKATAMGPAIRVDAGELHVNATDAEAAIISSGAAIYQRGNCLVRPASREVPASDGRTTIAAALCEMSVPSLIDVMSGASRWEKFDARSDGYVRANPPKLVAEILLSRFGLWKVPLIVGIVTTPTMRADGTILSAPGYDPATRLYHVADPSLKLHPAVHKPTRADAERALALLVELLGGFPLVDDVSKAVAVSALVTPVVRGAVPVAPLHLFRAPTPGSGKSFLADLVSTIATGRICPAVNWSADEAEAEKRLVGLLLAGFPIISLDNCNGELGGSFLCQAVERQLITVRPLGGSMMMEIESRATILGNGNQAQVSGDMVRRTLTADLDAKMERPEEREFTFDPVAKVMEDRSRYVSACLIIVRAYRMAGSPKQAITPVQSFGAWSDTMRAALVWLGMKDPAESIKQAREDDSVLGSLNEIMTEWDTAFGTIPMTVRRAIEAATTPVVPADEHGDIPTHGTAVLPHPGLIEVFLHLAGNRGTVDPERLGKWMRSHWKRPVGTRRFVKDGKTDGATRWKLETMR